MADETLWPDGAPVPEHKKERWPAVDRRALPLNQGTGGAGPFVRKHAVGTPHWTDPTRRNVEKAYGKWLAYLSAAEPDSLSIPPGDRLTMDRCRRYSDALAASGLALSSQGFHLTHLGMAARVIAPERDWTWLTDAATWVRQAAPPVRDKHSKVLSVAELYRLGTTMMDDAAAAQASLKEARQYRDGLILALWAARPWRISNFVALDLERHLTLTDSAGYVDFAPNEMKTQAARHWPLPATLIPYLRHYIEHVRPRLPGARRHNGFWPASERGCLTEQGLAKVLERHTRRCFGVALHPHAVRYSAATSTALSGSDAAGLITAVLGHADPRTADDYYVVARTAEAARQANDSLNQLHARLKGKAGERRE